MRSVTPQEIKALEERGCQAQNWNDVYVESGFDVERLRNVSFAGKCRLLGSDPHHSARVENVALDNVTLESGVVIKDIYEGIANYHIKKGARIERVRALHYSPEAPCGEGFQVQTLDEMGSRSVVVSRLLSAPLAFLYIYTRHDEKLAKAYHNIFQAAADELRPREQASVAEGSRIVDCGTLQQVQIEETSFITDCPSLKEVTLMGATLEGGVIGEQLLCLSGSHISEHSVMKHCLVGENSKINGGFVAHDSLIFSNCALSAGECCASVLGPHSVSMHRSTLLIGGCFSFFNAGSGTNQSNHHYRLGPMHYGMAERGCKTASDSYILWPARIGAFTKISGRILSRPESEDFPFSSLSVKDGATYLEPGSELISVGLLRDVNKWPARDGRTEETKRKEHLNYDMLNPYICYRLINGYKKMEQLLSKSSLPERVPLANAYVEKESLEKGKSHYRTALLMALMQQVKQNEAQTEELEQSSEAPLSSHTLYYDLLGSIISAPQLELIHSRMLSGDIASASQLQEALTQATDATPLQTQQNKEILSTLYPYATSIADTFSQAKEEAPKRIEACQKAWKEDAKRELNPRKITGFGILTEDSASKKAEAKALRSPLAELPFVQQLMDNTL